MKEKIVKGSIIIATLVILVFYFIYLDATSKKKTNDDLITVTTKSTSSDPKPIEDLTTSSTSSSTATTNKTTKYQQTSPKKPTTKTTTKPNDKQELEDYIKRVVACEMPALYNKEALKAQAIAARTYSLYQKSIGKGTISKEDQCYLSDAEMKSKWGSNKDKYYKLISNAVDETSNLVMKKNDRLFKSYYFSTSNGYTENSISVFGDGDLVSVESIWDKTSSGYEVITNFTKDDIIGKLGIFDNIIILKRNNTNHVEQVMIDNKVISGVEFRKLLGLRSTDFNITVENDNYSITTYGYGHGVGMSQYGANELAKQGKKYNEILKYYYGNIEIKTY